MKRIKTIIGKVKCCLAAVMRCRRMLGDLFFDTFGWRDYEYMTYDYYGNYKTKRVWRIRIFGREFTRDYDDDFA